MTGNVWDGWERLEMTEYSWKWLQMTGNGWNCRILIEMAGNGLKMLEMAKWRDIPGINLK